MSIQDELEEKNRRYRIEVIKFLEKIWNIKSNSLPEGMPQKMVLYKGRIKTLLDILLEEEIKQKDKEKFNNKSKGFKKSFSDSKMKLISDNARIILTKIGRNINKIKNSMTDITKMNGLYMEKNARKTFNAFSSSKRKKNLDKLNLKNEFLLDNIISEEHNKKNDVDNIIKDKKNMTFGQNINNKNKNLSMLNNINSEKNNKDDYIENFLFVNDNYRNQLNLAFLKFNANKHLKNIKTLVQIDPLIRENIVKINDEINEDIKFRCDKAHFRKKYESIKKKFARSNSVQNTPKMKFVNNKNQKPFPNINKKSSKKIIIFSPLSSNKSLNIFEKFKKEERNKYEFSKDEKIEEMKCMLKASSEINNLIENENISKKIDLYKTNYETHLRLNELYNINSDEVLKKDYFEKEKKKIVDKLGHIYQLKIEKNKREKENKIKTKINYDNDNLNKKFIEDKNEAIDEINRLINDNALNNSKISKD